jgi:hypothetical protein
VVPSCLPKKASAVPVLNQLPAFFPSFLPFGNTYYRMSQTKKSIKYFNKI